MQIIIIEYALRLMKRPVAINEVHSFIKDLVERIAGWEWHRVVQRFDPDTDSYINVEFDRVYMLSAIKAGKDRFVVGADGVITLRPERMADRIGFFRECARVWGDYVGRYTSGDDVLGEQLNWLQFAWIYALAVRDDGEFPAVLKEGEGLCLTVEQLAGEFQELTESLTNFKGSGGLLAPDQLQCYLMLMAAAELTLVEYVEVIRTMVSEKQSTRQFCPPWPIAMLMARMLGKDVTEVFDPSADASILPAVLACNPMAPAKADAIFKDRFAQYSTTLQARILGAELTSVVNEAAVNGDPNKKYAHCISAPPFGVRIKEVGGLRAVQSHEVALNQIIKRLAPNGRAVILVPESMLFSTHGMVIRKQLLDLGTLHAVISLPVDTFQPYAGVKASIVVLEKTGTTKEHVRFVDASLFIGERTPKHLALDVDSILEAYSNTHALSGVLDIRTSEILADELVSWTVSRFVSQLQIEGIVAEANGVKVVELGNVLYDDVLSLGDVAGLPIFQVSELSADVLEMTCTAKMGQVPSGLVKKGSRRVDVSVLLLARIGGRLKPTVFDPADGPAAVGNNVFMFRVDTQKAEPEYLASELRNSITQDQLDAYHQGSTIPSIAKVDLLRIRLRLPSLADQRRIVRERKEAILIARKEEIARQEEKHGLSIGEWQILGAVEHSFRPVVALLEQPMTEIRRNLDPMDGETRESVQNALVKMDRGLDRMRGLFKLINQVVRSDKGSLQPVPIDLRRLFRSEVRGIGQELRGLRIYFQCDDGLETEEGVIARVDQDQFALVIQNLFTNMAKHGKNTEWEELTVLVRISTRTDPGKSWTVITIENDGIPFRDGFTHDDLVAFGKRTDANKGNGIGGFLMDRIIANHGGRFTSGNLPLGEEAMRAGFDKDQRIDENHWEPHVWETALTDMTVRFTIELPISSTHG